MRTGHKFLSTLVFLAFALISPKSFAAGGTGDVAIRYHFAGATKLAPDTNFARSQAIFSIPPARIFEEYVLNRLADRTASALQLTAAGAAQAPIRPLFDTLLQAESTGCFGGTDKAHMDFVIALRANATTVAIWERALGAASHSPGDPISFDGFAGKSWKVSGSHPLWQITARDWLVVGRGEDLAATREQYLQSIKKIDFPATVSGEAWLSADIDWPLLSNWASLYDCPFKLAKTKVDVTIKNGRMRATAIVKYPAEIPWQPQPWHVPRELMNNPLSSFTASQDLAAYLSLGPGLSQLAGSPLTNQFFCWASREMPLESCGAWPVADSTNTLRKVGADGPVVLNPLLTPRGGSQLKWLAKKDVLVWEPMKLTSPELSARRTKDGDFLLAEIFPKVGDHAPVPEQLLKQFDQNQNLVYYDWELTGLRLKQWRVLSELLPVLPTPSAADKARWQKAAQSMTNSTAANQPKNATALVDAWLAGLSNPILDNTVTQITRTSPTELSVVRNSELLFTGVELVYISHWLADAPIGPIDGALLPWAKMSGPGANLLHH